MAEVKRPAGLSAAARLRWDEVTAAYELGVDEMGALESALRQEDENARLARELARSPVMTAGSAGQPVVNPLFAAVKAGRETAAKLWQAVQLPSGDEATGRAVRERARVADASRKWHERARERDRQSRGVS